MLKVNSEKLLADYNALVDKQAQGYAASEIDAKAFAQAHGYNDKKTEEFVAFVKELGKGGLSVIELHKLEHLAEYVEEVADEEKSELETALEEQTDPNAPNPSVNVL